MEIKKIILWVCIVLLSAMGVFAGISKVIPVESMKQTLATLGHGIWFTRFLGLAWIAGAIGLYFKQYRRFAALGIAFILFGAISAHITAGFGWASTVGLQGGPGILLILAFVILYLEGIVPRLLKNKV